MYEQRDNSGSLFKNDRREKETHPHAKGKAMIAGVMYYVSAWTKESAKGEKYQSLSFTPVDAAAGGGERRPAQKPAGANFQHPPRQARTAPTQPFGDEVAFKDSDLPF